METSKNTQPKYETIICIGSLLHLSKYKYLLKNCTSVQTTGRHWSIEPVKLLDLLPDTLEKLHFSGWYCRLNSHADMSDFFKHIDLTRFEQLKHLSVEQTLCRFILPNNLEYLIFDNGYDQPIILTPKIKHLVFGNNFSQPVELHKLLHLEELTIGASFNFPIILPKNLVKVTLGILKYPIIFPEKIKHIHIRGISNTNAFITCIDNLPDSTQTLEIANCGNDCNYYLFVNLPHNIHSIVLNDGLENICFTPLIAIENIRIGSVFARGKII